MISEIKKMYLKELPDADKARNDLAIRNKGLFFHSSARINLLKDYLKAEEVSIAACIKERLVGYMNVLVKRGPLGSVANSSPYYGSNGGIIIDLTIPEDQQLEIKRELIDFYYRVEQEHDIALSCIITNPLYYDDNFYRKIFIHDMEDSRIGQMTPLPDSEDKLFPLFHSKTRNMVRKSQKEGFEVYTSSNREDVDFLFETHVENMKEIGGIAKTKDYFEMCLFNSQYTWDLWVATYKGQRAAAMLLYSFGNVMEYVTPVIKQKYRSSQPLSLLIFEAMKNAVKNRAKWWNWGGTWKTQDGVYRFKNRWGALDMNYYYFIKFNLPGKKAYFLSSSKEMLLSSYPYFFTVPFDRLQSKSEE